MTVGVVGSGPAVEAVRAALADVGTEVLSPDVERLADVEFAVVVATVGAPVFEAANRAALRGGTPWLAVELGGVGGHSLPDVEAAVSGFAPDTGCHRCLRTRVAANADEADDEPATGPGQPRLAGAIAGQAAAELLSGAASELLGGVVELPHTTRRFLPVPNCPACGTDRAPTLTREYAEASLEESLSRAELAMDDRVGLVQSVGEVASFPVPYYLATNSDTAGFSDATAARQAAGVAVDWNEAFMKALGEALERYSAGVYRESAFTVAAPAEHPAGLAPNEFVLPETGFEHPDPEEPIPWVLGQRLATADTVALPAEFVQFPPPERRFAPSITTGLGLGNSTVEALLSGLYEVIERDATMLGWYSTFEPLKLSVDDDGFDELVRRARAEELTVTPLLSTQDVDVPVVTVAVHREGEWPRFAVGSGANLDAAAAARSALAEALQNWTELRGMGRDAAADEDGAIGRFADFPAAAREFVDVSASVPSERVGPDAVPEGIPELDAVLARLADADVEAYAARLTPRDVESLGFEAVRVLAPTAQPLFTDESFFGERARTVPRDLGFEPRLDRELHPYP